MGASNFDMVESLGAPLVPVFPTAGDIYFLDPANGDDSYDGKSIDRAFKTLTAAYAALTANQNDVLYYLAGSSSINLTAKLTWAKNYTHFIGVCAPTCTAQRARIFQGSSATGLSPLIDITASGCMFKNLYVFQGVDDNTSLINVQITGGRNYFENVHFAGGGHATQAINGGASLKLNGAEENTFVGCTIGVDTIAAATGMMGVLLDTIAHRNVFKECVFRMRAGHSGAGFVEAVDGTGFDSDNLFDKCIFINNSGTAMASAFVVPVIADASFRKLLLRDCMFTGTTKLDANDRGVLYGNMNAVTGADLSGVAVEMATT